MRSLSGKVLWFWVFLLIFYPLLVWTTGWIRRKKRLGSWKDHEATAPVLILTEAWEKMRIWQQRHIIFCEKQKMQNTFLRIFLHMFTHFYTCVSGFFLGLHMCKWIFFGLHMCKWIFFGLHMCKWIFFWLTHSYTSLHIHTHPYTFRYIVVFLVHAFVQWHHMIWNQTELECNVARLWSSVDVLCCGPLGSNSLILFFSKLRLSNTKFKNMIKFSSAAKKFEENLRNKGF